ncbi:MAG: methionine synthase [Mobilicoccus sp.]|nr:methionine synthase [Mobilicoccus sp.]
MSMATGIGSWPGDDMRTVLRLVRDLLGEVESDGSRFGLPYLPELPARGPGADLVGRSAGLLAEMPFDLQPSGWRLVDRPGRDHERTRALLRRDLDDLAEAFDGYVGPFKISLAGPWTLSAHVRLARGERSVVDEGARRDVAQSLAEGMRTFIGDVAKVLPGAELTVQMDEPSLPSVLAGALPTSSGFGRLRAVDREEVRRTLADVVTAAREAGAAHIVMHSCAPDVPVPLLRDTGVDALALDVTLLGEAAWEHVAEAMEAGVGLWAGVDVRTGQERQARDTVLAAIEQRWQRLGLPQARLDDLTLTPTCGLAGSTPADALRVHRVLLDAAHELHWRTQ